MASTTSRGLYGTIWRWHFYAGLFVAPFLVVLALTGAVYLFEREINDALQPELRFASSASAPSQPLGQLVAAAEAAYPGGRVTRIDVPDDADRTVQLFVTTAEGQPLRVFVDPPTARVLGAHVYTETLVGFADVVHGSLMLGDWGDAAVELAASWAVVLVCSGLYLWWPRGGRRSGIWFPRLLRARGRPLWRDLHQFAGLYTALLVLFLLLTGLPWAAIWGDKLLAPTSNALGLGYPEGSKRPLRSTSVTVAEAIGEAPWTLHHAPMPASREEAGPCGPSREAGSAQAPCPRPAPIGVDAAARILAQEGMEGGYRLSLPRGPAGVYMAITYPDRPEGQRTLQLDQYSGEVLGDIHFADYGAVAKTVEWGVAIHLGNYFGRANQILMLLPCIGIFTLVATGVGMWWKRRPRAAPGLGAPPRPANRVIGPGVLAAIVGLGAAFPLAGLSMIAVYAVDRVLVSLRR